jgi:hypothetical protein
LRRAPSVAERTPAPAESIGHFMDARSGTPPQGPAAASAPSAGWRVAGRSFVAAWSALAAAVVIALALVAWANRLPTPAPTSAPPTAFSADRAWPTLSYLADTIGFRVTGTPGNARALAYLEARLRAIPGLEVQVQDVTGAGAAGALVLRYHVRNLVARLPGRRPEAVLVSTHYDSPPESVGASDDGVAVAAVVELARALAAGPRMEHSVVLNINDGEEQGLLGASGFLRHPWLASVRAFVNLESAGPGGKAILFQAGPGNSWLTRAYARAAPHPYGSVYGQDIFQSGAIPSATDFEVYRDGGGLRGLDVAFYRDGYAYHTALDRTDRIARGSLQHMGDNALAVVRELAAGALPGDVGGGPSVYYDLLGTAMVAYDARWAMPLAIAACLLAAAAVWLAGRAFRLGAADVALAALTAALAAGGAVAFAMGAAWIVSVLFARPHGWFAHPARGYVAYGGAALAAMLAVHALLHRRYAGTAGGADRAVAAAWAGALIVTALGLLALAALGVGSAFLLLWWAAPAALGLAGWSRSGGRHFWPAAALGFTPGLVLSLYTVESMLALFVPVGGRFPLPFPFDFVVAGLVAVGVALAGTVPLALSHRAGWVWRAAAAAALVGVVGLAVMASTFPYTPRRPQRITLVHEAEGDRGQVRAFGYEFVSPARALAGVPGVRALESPRGLPGRLGVPAGGTGFAPPAAQVVAERSRGSDREVDIRLRPADAYALRLRVPAARFVAWSLGGSPRDSASVREARFLSAPDSGWLVTLRVSGREPVPVELGAVRSAATPAAREFVRRLPAWATANVLAVDWRVIEF